MEGDCKMDQIMNYIFSGLQRCDDNFLNIKKAFIAQNKINKITSITLLLGSYATYKTYKKLVECHSNIQRLSEELEELKKTKGESEVVGETTE